MADAIICDKCDKLFKDNDITHGVIKDLWDEQVFIDLCDKCKDKLDEWLNPVATKKIRAYLKGGK